MAQRQVKNSQVKVGMVIYGYKYADESGIGFWARSDSKTGMGWRVIAVHPALGHSNLTVADIVHNVTHKRELEKNFPHDDSDLWVEDSGVEPEFNEHGEVGL